MHNHYAPTETHKIVSDGVSDTLLAVSLVEIMFASLIKC